MSKQNEFKHKSLTVEEVEKKKATLEFEVLNLLRKFEFETHCSVSSLNMMVNRAMGEKSTVHSVDITVEI